MSGKKSIRCLELQSNTPQSDPLLKLLTTQNIIDRSKHALGMAGTTTVSECVPEITLIARENGLDLNNQADWKEAKRILAMNNLNR